MRGLTNEAAMAAERWQEDDEGGGGSSGGGNGLRVVVSSTWGCLLAGCHSNGIAARLEPGERSSPELLLLLLLLLLPALP